MNPLLQELTDAGLVQDCTDLDGLSARLDAGPLALYCGFGPTAPSLHVGSLTALRVLSAFEWHGHQVLIVIGGATGLVGDPSGKRADRPLLDEVTLAENVRSLQQQISGLLPRAALDRNFHNNLTWWQGASFLSVLRDVGRHFRVNQMIEKDSVKLRLESEVGLSFTEFAYMLLQAQDFAHLNQEFGCILQVGGSDQWGNITAGTELIRRRGGGGVFGLVWPLMKRADGEKFGKSADGNVWLDPVRTSPFKFYQFWINIPDEDVGQALRKFTTLPPAEVDEILAEQARAPGRRPAQRRLAAEVTRWVHGSEALERVQRASEVLFNPEAVPQSDDLALLVHEVPGITLPRSDALEQGFPRLAVLLGAAPSKAEAQRIVASGGFYINGTPLGSVTTFPSLLEGREHILVRRGKKQCFILRILD